MHPRVAAVAIFSVGMAFAAQCQEQKAPKLLITSPVYTRPQRLVDMDHGRRMNIYCTGSGSPAVILDAGMGDSTISWALVQPAIAAKTKVCSYDRAGLGFSDGSSRPSTAANIAEDLHALLEAAHVASPYILVGHSAAGMYVRVFADHYFDEVAGMVLVEPSHEDQSVRGWAIGAPGQQAKWDAFLKEYSVCVTDARQGLLVKGTLAYKKCVGDPDPRFSQAINDAQAQYAATGRWQAAAASERQSVFYASADETRATRKHFGDMPIIVLTHSPYPKAKDETQEERNERTLLWESLHLDIAAMSTRGVNEIVPNSGHYIQYDHPQVVIDAIDQALSIAQEDAQKAK
ncbi:MAG TPA: alpha/beta hydrolase [Rhodanobacter sp.]|nr:alpha/beta hydrolase [Rhodanobacter sp.]